MTRRTRTSVLLGILGMAIALALTQRWWLPRVVDDTAVPRTGGLALTNQLAIGAAAVLRGPYPIELSEPIELDGRSRADIYELRARAVAPHAALIRGTYEPEDLVYHEIVDGLPWWGTTGQFVFGPGPRSIDGPSEESRFLTNPFLLVGVDFFGASIFFKQFRWDERRGTGDALAEAGLSPHCKAHSLVWWPGEARAEVRYDYTRWLMSISDRLAPGFRFAPTFDLLPINARDLGLNFLRVDADASRNIGQRYPFDQPVRIRGLIHQGGSCKYPGGCNNASPYQRELTDVYFTDTPAALAIDLWRERPASSDVKPDFRFTIHIE